MTKPQTALVTGATSGIGTEFARRYAERGLDLVLVARREAELNAIADELTKAHGCHVDMRVCDLGDATARAGLVEELRGREIDVCVNNAGYGLYGTVGESDPARTSGMVELNCQALVELAQAVLPGMLERHSGTIVNVASTAAFQPLASMAVYAASKSFVLSFTQALWTECKGTGVKVTAICPGPTQTAFFEVAGADDVMTQRRTAAQVVETTFAALEKNKPYVVDGAMNNVGAQLGRVAPYAIAEKAAAQVLKRQK